MYLLTLNLNEKLSSGRAQVVDKVDGEKVTRTCIEELWKEVIAAGTFKCGRRIAVCDLYRLLAVPSVLQPIKRNQREENMYIKALFSTD